MVGEQIPKTGPKGVAKGEGNKPSFTQRRGAGGKFTGFFLGF